MLKFSELLDVAVQDASEHMSALDQHENYEMELRLGRCDSKQFSPFVTKKTFNKIMGKFVFKKTQNVSVQAFIDKTYRHHHSKEQMILRSQKDVEFNKISEYISKIIDGKILMYADLIENKNVKLHTKQKGNQHTFDNVRYNFNIESQQDLADHHPKSIDWIRLKTRFSCEMNEMCRLDCTIVQQMKYHEWISMGVDKTMHNLSEHKPVYIVEIEIYPHILKQLETAEIHIEYFRHLLGKAVQDIQNIIFDETHFLFHQIPKHPVTLQRKHLSLLQNDYAVSAKADGVRLFLIIQNGKAYFQNPTTTTVERMIPIISSMYLKPSDVFVLDGEYISDKRTDSWRFLIFDALIIPSRSSDDDFAMKWKDIRGETFQNRMKLLAEFQDTFQALSVSLSIVIEIKKFIGLFDEDLMDSIYKNAALLWNAHQISKLYNSIDIPSNMAYDIDGVLFAAKHMPYYGGELPNFKWKQDHTIDVRVEYVASINFTYFHFAGYKERHKIWYINGKTLGPDDTIKHARFVISDQFTIEKLKQTNLGMIRPNKRNGKLVFFLGMYGKIPKAKNKIDIVEMKYFEKKWHFVGFRSDKQKPNGHPTIYNNVQAIIENISMNDVNTFKPCEPVGEWYDNVCNKMA